MTESALTPNMTVGAVVAEYPAISRLLDALGIDYCCAGSQTLADAAERAQMSVASFLTVLRTTIAQARQGSGGERDWQTAPLGELIDHMLKVHHVFLDEELPRIGEMLAQVRRELGDKHSEMLTSLEDTYTVLCTKVEAHIVDEEQRTFPMIRQLLAGERNASILQALSTVEHQHVAVVHALVHLRTLTHDYQTPIDVCKSYCDLYSALQALERILRRHIHLENNILFPRIKELLAAP